MSRHAIHAFGSVSTLVATALTLLYVSPAHAANGTLRIQQQSPISDFGDWSLQGPSTTVNSFQQEADRNLGAVVEGTYTLRVTAPRGASTMIKVLDGATTVKSGGTTTMEFQIAAGQALVVVIEYAYNGTVTVESNVDDAPFELMGGQIRYTGTTPATFDNLPPFQYSVHFGRVDDCGSPKPYKRTLEANGSLTFKGMYDCDATQPEKEEPVVEEPAMEEPAMEEDTEDKSAAASLWQSVQQKEVLPGGTIQFTVGLKNLSKSTLRGLTVTEQFDAALLSIVEPVEWSGDVQDNLIVWQIPQIFAGQTWQATFKAKVAAEAPAGTQVTVTARASGDDLENTTVGNLSTSTTVGVATLPKTGMGADLLFLVLTSIGAAGFTFKQRNN